MLTAFYGRLGDLVNLDTDDVSTLEGFTRAFTHGRYGGSPLGSWDGVAMWTPKPVPRETEDELLTVLRPALDAFPTIPAGWVGWFDIRETD